MEVWRWYNVVEACRHTSVIRFPPARRSHCPYHRSAGHHHCSLRVTSRGRGWSNGLVCDSKFVRCLMLLT